jgi:hypothetical protein
MKTVRLERDFDYCPHRSVTVRFLAGITYRRVLERAARDIERAGAGRIVGCSVDAAGDSSVVDAWNAWQRRR